MRLYVTLNKCESLVGIHIVYPVKTHLTSHNVTRLYHVTYTSRSVFDVTINIHLRYYNICQLFILTAVISNWQVFLHFDGFGYKQCHMICKRVLYDPLNSLYTYRLLY